VGLVGALAVTGLLCGCSRAGKCSLATVADLPVTTVDRAFFTDIMINGSTAHLQVDTGAYANLLNEAALQRLGMAQQTVGSL
jgi:hypothetical protein